MSIEDLINLNQQLCHQLWCMTDVKGQPTKLPDKLIFPEKRDGTIRISEQESRIVYCNLLDSIGYHYSIETPTEKLYEFSGGFSLSASSDLSIYSFEDNKFEKVANVEFKAHNPKKEDIKKDIEKLIKEDLQGNWFHTLKNIDSRTLLSLFQKFRESFYEFEEDISKLGLKKISVLFCFCVLDKNWGCMKHFLFEPDKDYKNYVDSFFILDYSVESNIVKVVKENFWSLISKEESFKL